MTLLKQLGLVKQFFFLNDPYELTGISKNKRFNEYLDIKQELLEEAKILKQGRVTEPPIYSSPNNNPRSEKKGEISVTRSPKREQVVYTEEDDQLRTLHKTKTLIRPDPSVNQGSAPVNKKNIAEVTALFFK